MSKSRADTKGKYIDAKGEKGKEDFYAFEKKIIGYRHVSHFDAHFDMYCVIWKRSFHKNVSFLSKISVI